MFFGFAVQLLVQDRSIISVGTYPAMMRGPEFHPEVRFLPLSFFSSFLSLLFFGLVFLGLVNAGSGMIVNYHIRAYVAAASRQVNLGTYLPTMLPISMYAFGRNFFPRGGGRLCSSVSFKKF
jgi:hypothetical protein